MAEASSPDDRGPFPARDLALVLRDAQAEYVLVGDQAVALRTTLAPPGDIELLVRPSPENIGRVREAIRRVTGERAEIAHVCGRDFQAAARRPTGAEIHVRLKLFGVPDFAHGLRNASDVDVSGLLVPTLELPALRAAARDGVARSAALRAAIEARLAELVRAGALVADELVLACCLDASIAAVSGVAQGLPGLASATAQPLLQARLLSLGGPPAEALRDNPALHPEVQPLVRAGARATAAIRSHPERFAELLARLPLLLPPEGRRLSVAA